MLIDSHCHIHDTEFFPDNREEVYARAIDAGVQMIVVGTSEADAQAAVDFASTHEGVWSVVGVHPHDTKSGWARVEKILADKRVTRGGAAPTSEEISSSDFLEEGADRVTGPAASDLRDNSKRIGNDESGDSSIVGIGEIGLDYFYDNSPRETQIRALEEQLQWAVDYDLPVSFHVREAYDDFWPVFDNFSGVRGVLHCFTDTAATLEKALTRGLYIGVNGISTFTKDPAQRAMFASVPLERMLLETDAPFLTPSPFRGRINEPAYVVEVAKYQAEVRSLAPDDIISATTANAKALFSI